MADNDLDNRIRWMAVSETSICVDQTTWPTAGLSAENARWRAKIEQYGNFDVPPQEDWEEAEVTSIDTPDTFPFEISIRLWQENRPTHYRLSFVATDRPPTSFDLTPQAIEWTDNLGPFEFESYQPKARGPLERADDSRIQSSDSPVPEKWRAELAGLIHLLVIKDYEQIASSNYLHASIDPEARYLADEIESYPDGLVDFPDEGWRHTDCRDLTERGRFRIEVPLWTNDQGLSELLLEAEIQETLDNGVEVFLTKIRS